MTTTKHEIRTTDTALTGWRAMFLIALAARADRRTVLGALGLALLVLLAQPALAGAGDNDKWVGGLHALDGMLILILSFWLAGTAHRRQAARWPR